MKNIERKYLIVFLCLLFIPLVCYSADNYQDFNVAIYTRVFEVQKMRDLDWLEESFNLLSKYIKIDKVYLETHRDLVTADRETVLKAKDFFESKGIKTSGGITTTVSERDQFKTFCYSNPEHREKIREIVEYTAGLFDEVILDDFFFTNCKCELCIKAKGNKNWTKFRLDQMEEVTKNLVIRPAKKVNPDVNMIIKYPNWYEHYQFLGYNLEAEPKLFDMIYTGTETRDPVYTQQHLQQYQSYAIMRYLESVKPGKNGGGWVDPFSRRYLDRYAEQLRLTLFSKPKEVTLFSFGHLLESIYEDDTFKLMSMVAPVAGNVFEKVNSFLGKLGQPVGIKSYKPYHSSGEDFLHNYIGMLGIPMEITPEFPYDEDLIFLTEEASFDKDIVKKIKGQLLKGKDVVITSGFYRALQGKGIEDIVDLECTDKKALVHTFSDWRDFYVSEDDILIPQVWYATNDSWELITAFDNGIGYSIFHQASYGRAKLYVLTIPDNFGELYELPREVLTAIKRVMMRNFFVYTDSPSKVSLFVYDNNTFIIHSFKENNTNVKIILDEEFNELVDMLSKQEIRGYKQENKMVFDVYVSPHNYRVFKAG